MSETREQVEARGTVYDQIRSEIKDLPQMATEMELYTICLKRRYKMDVMTDQIDIRSKAGRKIAVYMIGV